MPRLKNLARVIVARGATRSLTHSPIRVRMLVSLRNRINSIGTRRTTPKRKQYVDFGYTIQCNIFIISVSISPMMFVVILLWWYLLASQKNKINITDKEEESGKKWLPKIYSCICVRVFVLCAHTNQPPNTMWSHFCCCWKFKRHCWIFKCRFMKYSYQIQIYFIQNLIRTTAA